MHLVMRDQFWSHDNDGGHTNRYSIVKNPMLHANFMALYFIELQSLPMEVLHAVYLQAIWVKFVMSSGQIQGHRSQ